MWGWLEGQGEQFGTHLGLLGTSGRYGYFWIHIWAGRGSEPVWRRCPETPPKVRAIHGATFGGPNSELIKALKKVCPPPLNFYIHKDHFLEEFFYFIDCDLSKTSVLAKVATRSTTSCTFPRTPISTAPAIVYKFDPSDLSRTAVRYKHHYSSCCIPLGC